MEIINLTNELVNYGMGKLPKRPKPKLYLVDWIDAISTRKEVAEAVGASVSYFANLKAGRKKNPSGELLFMISEFLGCTVNDFYRPPPAGHFIDTMAGFSPEAREALVRNRPKKG